MLIFTDSDPTTNPLNDFLKNYGIWIALGVAALVFIAVIVMFCVALYKRKHEPTYTPRVITQSEKSKDILSALGGIENIKEHSLNGSRMSLVLIDDSLLDETKLKELGIDSIIKMSKKVILVVKNDLSSLYQEIFSNSN